MSTTGPQTEVQLARHLGLFEAVMIGVGAMIGAGIFVLTGIASGQAGPAALLAFGLNGVVTLFTALSYAELSSAIPEAGGGYSFVKKVMPNPVAFLAGWMLWFAYVVACSLYAKGFGSYFLEFFHRYVPTVTEFLSALLGHGGSVALLTVLIGVLFLAVNIAGTHASGQTENVITLAKIVILAVFVFFGIKAILGAPEVTRENFTPFLPMGAGGVLTAMGLTFIAFEGYDLIATVSEEVAEPRKTIPRAILWSLGITIAIYLMVVFVTLGAVPAEGGVPVWRMLGEFGEMGIVQAADAFMPDFGVVLVLGGGLFATLSALNATILASSRVAFSMGRDWMLPNRLSRIHSRRRTPVMAITVSGVLFLLVAVFLPLETIGTASSLLFLLTFTLVNLAAILYRRRSQDDDEVFRMPLFPLTPFLGIVTCLGIALYQVAAEWEAWVLAAGWVVTGLVIYLAFFATRASVADVPRIIESPELGTLKHAPRYRVLLPVSNPERVVPLMELAGMIASSSQGEVVVLDVVELPDVTAYSEGDPFVEEARQVLGDAQRVAMTRRIPFSSLLKIGRSAAKEIVEVAKQNQSSLVLLGYKKDEDPLENSVIHEVIDRQPSDIAILRCTGESLEPVRRLLVPIGGKEVHDTLKVRIVHSLQRSTDCEVSLLLVLPPEAGAGKRRWAEEALARAASVYQIREVDLVLEEAEKAAEGIVDHAREDDLLILGMKEEKWFQAFFFGSLAQQVAGKVPCPTLLTKAKPTRRSTVRKIGARTLDWLTGR